MSLKHRFLSSSLKFRITFFFVTITTIIFFTLGFLILKKTELSLQKNFDVSLFNYTSEINESLNLSVFGRLKVGRKELLAEKKFFPFNIGNSFLRILNKEGEILAYLGNLNPPVRKQDIETVYTRKPSFKNWNHRNKTYRLLSYPVVKQNIPLIIQVGVPLDHLKKQISEQKHFFYILAPIFLTILFIIGYFFSAMTLTPLLSIIHKTQKMNASNLSDKLPEKDFGKELTLLSKTLNSLFERVHLAFKSQEDFIANASHQLRTPLTIMKGELEVFNLKKRPEEVQQFHQKFSRELDHLTHIVQDLLTLANLDSGTEQLEKEDVYLDEIIFSLSSRMQPLAAENNSKINLTLVDSPLQTHHFKIQGDKDLLETMFQNLLENAIEHSPKNEDISIKFGQKYDCIFVSIQNKGLTIPKEIQERLFERFYKAPNSKGLGLGLAISQQIAQIHSGSIIAESSDILGIQFTTQIPCSKPDII